MVRNLKLVKKGPSLPPWRGAGRPPLIAHRVVVEIGRLGPTFDFVGGHLVLDFNNTAAWPHGRPSNNRVPRPGDLIRWASESKLISTSEETRLRRLLRTKTQYDCAERELTDAHRFRGVLHEMLIAAERRRQPSSDLRVEFDQRLRKARKSLKPQWREGQLRWVPPPAKKLTSIVERIAWRAGEFFASVDVDRLRSCANPGCGWFFIDRSSNNSRRWCKMRECGDRAKSKRYYQKNRR